MPQTFQYEALDAAGRLLTGRVDANHPREAQRTLESQGLTLVELAPARAEVLSGDRRSGAKQPNRRPGDQREELRVGHGVRRLRLGAFADDAALFLAGFDLGEALVDRGLIDRCSGQGTLG